MSYIKLLVGSTCSYCSSLWELEVFAQTDSTVVPQCGFCLTLLTPIVAFSMGRNLFHILSIDLLPAKSA